MATECQIGKETAMKKLLAIVLLLAMCFCSFLVSTNADDAFTVRVESKEAKVGERVEVDISIENNKGILAMLFVLHYDSDILKLVGVKNGTVVDGGIFGNDYAQIPYKMLWNSASDENFTGDGTLATLTFEVLDTAPGVKSDITLTYKEKNVYDVDLNPVSISVINGGVTVISDEIDPPGGWDTTDEETTAGDTTASDKPAPPEPEEDYEIELFRFEDVKEDDWYYEAVKFAFDKGITKGVSETSFAPNSAITRGEFITMLCRAYSVSEMTGDNFDDAGDTWYTGYLAAAKQLGISSGVGSNKFAPERKLTREEMVTLIYNYLNMIGEADGTSAQISFADADAISDWAKPGVAFASEMGYVKGKGGNLFDPKGGATRAEMAQIFFNIFKQK